MDIRFKRASELSMEELLRIWNASFEEYLVNMKMDLTPFIRRAAFEELDLEGSVVMYVDDEPAGLTLNGYRKYGEEQRVWNGGTGIVKARRGQGLGKPLIEASLNTYKAREVDTALLEVFTQNEPAVRLYKSCGYEEVDQLRVLTGPDQLEASAFGGESSAFDYKVGVPAEAGALDFYDHSGPWQTHWQCLKEGQSVILTDGNEPLGYALYRNGFDSEGKHVSVVIANVGIHPGTEDQTAVLNGLLRFVLKPGVELKRHANHVRSSRPQLGVLLEQAGFKTSLELLHMKRNMMEV